MLSVVTTCIAALDDTGAFGIDRAGRVSLDVRDSLLGLVAGAKGQTTERAVSASAFAGRFMASCRARLSMEVALP